MDIIIYIIDINKKSSCYDPYLREKRTVWKISKEYFKTTFLSNKYSFIHLGQNGFGMGRNNFDVVQNDLGCGVKQLRAKQPWDEMHVFL